MTTSYFASTATNTNYVRLYATNYGGGSWTTTQTVNFAISNGPILTETFVMAFGDNTDLILKAELMFDPPTGKTCIIQYISLLFTRIA